jgi:hypothetical protein
MGVVRTIVAVVFAAAIAVTGCTAHSSADRPAPPPPAPNSTHAPGSGALVQVGIDGLRACLGANSLTYLVVRTGRGWAARAITAIGAVA